MYSNAQNILLSRGCAIGNDKKDKRFIWYNAKQCKCLSEIMEVKDHWLALNYVLVPIVEEKGELNDRKLLMYTLKYG